MIGLGNVGTAIANQIAANGYTVTGWEHNRQAVEEVNASHTNEHYLPGVELSPNLRATSDLGTVVQHSDILFIGLPTLFIHKTLEPVYQQVNPQATLVNLAKGIDQHTGLTAFQSLALLFPQHRRVMLAGPAIANEFARGMPTVVVLAGEDTADLLRVARLLDSDTFRTRFSSDAIGAELGGILKNMYTIGLGMFDGKQISSVNFRAVYLTSALEEITRIGVAMGGRAETFAYLAGMGDLLATSLSQHSHNRHMGELLAQGLTLDEIREQMGVVPEGFNTMKLVLALAEKMHVSLPLARGLWEVIHGRDTTEHFIAAFSKDFIDT
jgi:glycerol-3-phosphate dehydrogenase (NAD(P)+)